MENKTQTTNNENNSITHKADDINNSLIKIHNCEHLYNDSLNCIKDNFEDESKMKGCNVIIKIEK